MGKFSDDLLGLPKSDNTARAAQAKVIVRERVLDAVEAAGSAARVLDAYAGEGHMHRAVWRRAAGCVGCDWRFFRDERMAFVADNRRVMRSIDLSAFNVFDLDAYGSPWEQVAILAHRRKLAPGETVGLVITEGSGLKLKMGCMPHPMAMLAGMRPRQPGLGGVQDDLVDRALLGAARLMGAAIGKRWQAVGKVGSRMMYVGLLLHALEPAP